jgi:pSer/pThr/pTyr-binding forkhead associated (FHA) protein
LHQEGGILDRGDLEHFLEACGASEPLELETARTGEGTWRRHTLERPFALIGRDKRSDIRLNDTRAALRHAYLQVIAGRAFVVDLGSRSGTRWQGKAYRKEWLGPDETLGMGRCSVRLARDEKANAPASSKMEWDPCQSGTADRLQFPAATLECLGASVRTQRWQLDSVLTLVGRASTCQLRLPDPSMSAFHCALLLTAHGLWMVDLFGRDGVWVNGRRMRWAHLDDGACLQVGRFPMRVWYQPATLAAPVAPFKQESAVGEPWAGDPDNLPGNPAAISEKTATESGVPSASLGAPEPALPVVTTGGFIPLEPFTPFTVPAVPMNNGAFPPALLQHLAALQQGMMAQFQQSMVMMLQMMTTMRHEEMELLREVLRRVGGLSREVRATAAQRKKTRPPRQPQDQGKEPAEPKGPLSPGAASSSTEGTGHTQSDNGSESFASQPTSGPTQDARTMDSQFHAWLSGRIAQMEKERQGAWQRLLSSLLGK